jgi:hypothetical protein
LSVANQWFAGARNGPITHTDPAATYNEGFLAVTTLP